MAEREHRVRLFKVGDSQALRIPAGLELDGDRVIVRKDGDRLIIESVPKWGLFQALRKLGALEEPADMDDGETHAAGIT